MISNDSLKALGDLISEKDETIKAIFDKVEAGDLDADVAIQEVLAYAKENPQLEKEISEMFMDLSKEDMIMETDLEVFVTPPSNLSQDITTDMIWEDRSEEGKRSRLNPQYEAHLAERLQFDGDVPELRSGNIGEDVKPAVPVIATSRNPVIVGEQLKRASEEVRSEIDTIASEHKTLIEEQVESGALVLSNMSDEDLVTALTPPAPESYQNGQVPVKREIAEVTTTDLISLDQEKKQANCFEVVGTTQGRRSAIPVIAEIIKERFKKNNLDVDLVESCDGEPVSQANWTFTINGSFEVQGEFSFFDTAGYSLAYKLLKSLRNKKLEKGYKMLVTPINEYSIREVGWKVLLFS